MSTTTFATGRRSTRPASVIPSWALDDEPIVEPTPTVLADLARAETSYRSTRPVRRLQSNHTTLIFQALLFLALILAVVASLRLDASGGEPASGTGVNDQPPTELYQPAS